MPIYLLWPPLATVAMTSVAPQCAKSAGAGLTVAHGVVV